MFETIVIIIAGLLLLDLLVRVAAVAIALPVFERKLPFDVQPFDADPTAESFQVTTADGFTIQGCVLPGSKSTARGVVMFCPELEGNRWSAAHYGHGLRRAGFHVVSFDFCNQGDSDRRPGYEPQHWLTKYEIQDAKAVFKYIQSRADWANLPRGILGISRGGATALAIAARNPSIRAVACEGAYSNTALSLYFTYRWASLYVPAWLLKPFPVWHIRSTIRLIQLISGYRKNCSYVRIERLLPRLRNRETLLIAGNRDSYVAPEITRELARRMGKSEDSIWIVPGAKHNMARSVQQEEYDDRLIEFFDQIADDSQTVAQPNPVASKSETYV